MFKYLTMLHDYLESQGSENLSLESDLVSKTRRVVTETQKTTQVNKLSYVVLRRSVVCGIQRSVVC